ncbi:MAG: acyl-CoA dehydrogenase family protein, partial [Nocardioidaceae bacterium]|nr:acyl-CoA dehydrogenase family protein [Nocardioidaceae bacterium]
MLRTVYNEDHEAFRAAVREFLDRSVWPNVDSYIENKALPREYWLEAGRQGLLGLDIPEEFGGMGAEDFRFNAVL